MEHHRYILGNFDATGLGHPCEARLCWRLGYGNLTAWGQVYDPSANAIIWGGHRLETIAAQFPRDAKARRMVEIFHRWSHNYLRRGTKRQEEILRAALYPGYPTDFLDWADTVLSAAGSLVDNGQRYNRGYFQEEIPFDVHAEIMTWSQQPETSLCE